MSRLRWPDSTNSVSEKPGTIHSGSSVRARSHHALGGPVVPETIGQCEAEHVRVEVCDVYDLAGQ